MSALERLDRIRAYAQDALDNGWLSGGAVGNMMAIRDEVDALKLEAASPKGQVEAREKLAAFMISHSVPTGHGDTIDDLLVELGVWIAERRDKGWVEAVDDVLAERQRQIAVEGWTPEHDDAHDRGELADAASCYARGTDRITWQTPDPEFPRRKVMTGRILWPWAAQWWKPTDRRRNLVKAGALILAEIERLDRAEGRSND
jgi:hypothetical protein